MMRLALYQPDIPQNTATLMRFCACMDIALHIVDPCGFVFDDSKIRRVGMDYRQKVKYHRHKCWQEFLTFIRTNGCRIILLSTKASIHYTDFSFQSQDVLLLGRESCGVPQTVHDTADARLTIAMKNNCRSLNVAVAGVMVAAEALRQRSMSRS